MTRENELAGRVGGFTRWSRESDRTQATAAPRAAFLRRFKLEVDPEGKLSPTKRAQMAEAARRAYFARLSLKRWQSRRRKS